MNELESQFLQVLVAILEEAVEAANKISYPVMAAFTLEVLGGVAITKKN